jgi:hypothetical protein
MGPSARHRAEPHLAVAMAGLGGALAALGLALAIVGDDGSQGVVTIAGVVVLGISLAVRLRASHAQLGAAAVGAGAFGIPLLVGGITGGLDDPTVPLLLATLAYALAWALPGFRGRPLMLGLAAMSAVATVSAAVASDSIRGDGPFPDELQGLFTDQGVAYLVCGAALALAVARLDARGYHAVGTSLVVPALLAATVGVALVVGSLGESGGPMLVVVVGTGLALVGRNGRRRATTWYGATMIAVGAVALAVTATEPSSTPAIGGLLLLTGAVLVSAPLLATRVRDAQQRQ